MNTNSKAMLACVDHDTQKKEKHCKGKWITSTSLLQPENMWARDLTDFAKTASSLIYILN